jgi:hypothetical protein
MQTKLAVPVACPGLPGIRCAVNERFEFGQ